MRATIKLSRESLLEKTIYWYTWDAGDYFTLGSFKKSAGETPQEEVIEAYSSLLAPFIVRDQLFQVTLATSPEVKNRRLGDERTTISGLDAAVMHAIAKKTKENIRRDIGREYSIVVSKDPSEAL